MFSKIVINHYDDDTGTTYTCSRCSNSVKFYIRDFNKHWNSDFSNLKNENFIGATEGKSSLDFYCPKCSVPTTVIFKLEAGGMHGEYWYTIDSVQQGNSL